jgi:hypothetical protein
MPLPYAVRHRTRICTRIGSSQDDATTIRVDDRAGTRAAIFDALRSKGRTVREASDWHGKPTSHKDDDWHYDAIVLHHAGNSFSRKEAPVKALHRVEGIDGKRFAQMSYHYAIDCHGTIYEALDIRRKGSHLKDDNTGRIGIVLLADLSVRGEATKHSPGVWQVFKEEGWKAAFSEWAGIQKDRFDVIRDTATETQLDSLSHLVDSLCHVFSIRFLGGHREFAEVQGSSRACPGANGLIIAQMLRTEFKLVAPW